MAKVTLSRRQHTGFGGHSRYTTYCLSPSPYCWQTIFKHVSGKTGCGLSRGRPDFLEGIIGVVIMPPDTRPELWPGQ